MPNFSCAVTSVTRVLKNIISNFCGDECKKITTKFRSNKFTSRFVCVDATTGQYHTENDGTWTVTAVPNQNTTKKKNVYFKFKLDKNIILKVKLSKKSSLFYTAKMMTHRQSSKSKHNFVNVSAYTNERILNHVSSSVIRNMKIKYGI